MPVLQAGTQVQPGCASCTWRARLQLGKQPQLTSSSCGPATQAAPLQQRRRSLAACLPGLLRLASCLHGQWASSAACAACACRWFLQRCGAGLAPEQPYDARSRRPAPSCPVAAVRDQDAAYGACELQYQAFAQASGPKPAATRSTIEQQIAGVVQTATGRGRGPFVTGREGYSNVSRPELTHDRERGAAINLAHRPGPQNLCWVRLGLDTQHATGVSPARALRALLQQ